MTEGQYKEALLRDYFMRSVTADNWACNARSAP